MDLPKTAPPLELEVDKLSAGFVRVLIKTLDVIDAEVVWMNQASQVLYANQTMCKKLGYAYDEILGMKIWEWDPLLPREAWSDFWKDLKNNKRLQFESWHRSKTGHSFPVYITAFYFQDDDQEYLIATAKDISRLESISSEKELLSTAVKQTSSGIVITDALRRVTWVNEGFCKITGYTLADVEGQSLKAFLQGKNTNKNTLQKIKNLLDNRQPVDVEILNYHKSGRPYWNHLRITPIVEHGKLTHFVAVQDDITVFKQTDEASLAAMTKFQQLVDLLPVGIYMTDANGNCTFVNPFWSNMAGFGIEDAKGNGWYRAVHEEDREYVTQSWTRMVQSKGKWGAEYRFKKANGEICDIYGIATEVIGKDGKTEGYIGVNLDVSEQKALRNKLTQLEKMESVGKLAGGIAHDFNNQLAGVMALTELIQMQTSDDTITDYLERILNTVTRSKELTSKLLAFSRQGQATLTPIHIDDVIHETVSILNHTLDRRIELITKLNAQNDTVKGNASLLQNALLNMGLNAKDAMQEGGRLLYSTQEIEINHDHKLKLHEGPESEESGSLSHSLTAGEYILIKVQDTGSGMSAETKDKIFDPFFTTKDIGKGTGMGLASVYGTVQEHGGAITVESEPGNGSTFCIYLPLDQQNMTSEGELSQKHAEPESGKLTILLVDDEEDIRSFSSEFLNTAGHTVIQACDGEDAVTKYQQYGEKIDLLLLDMNMPKRNGLQCFNDIRKLNPEIKAIICTGFAEKSHLQQMTENGVSLVLEKPYKMQDLIDAVARAQQEL